MEGHDNWEDVKNRECGSCDDTNTSINIFAAREASVSSDICEGNKSSLSRDNLPSGDHMVKITHQAKPSQTFSCEEDRKQCEASKLISSENKNVTVTDYRRSISLKDESFASESESMKRAEKRRRRRSTIRMTAKQTQEIHHSTSFTSPKDNTTSDTTGYVSCDDELLMKSDSPKRHYISRVNIFVVARAVHHVGSTGEMVKAEDPPCAQCVTIPSSAALIQPEILNSGLAFSSGKKFRVVSLLNFYCFAEESLVKFLLIVSILTIEFFSATLMTLI